ncbi:MAG: ABC transporter substrate-binding protein [Thermodesulfobacteriota bacterium]|nr:ABC transporter substrate-binding protein [Thermodesulfobacteriota bacterium]
MKNRLFGFVLRSFIVGLLSPALFFFLMDEGYAQSVRGVTNDTIKIGGIADHTGPIATICKPVIEAFKNYTRYTNEQGGIHGRKIKLLMEDDRYSIPAGIAAFKKLLYRDKVLALLGPVSIGETKALYHQIEKLKIPTLPVVPEESAIKPFKRYIFLPHDFYDDEIGVVFEYIMEELEVENPKVGFVTADRESGKMVKASAQKWADFHGLPLHTEILPASALEAVSQILSMKRKKINCMLVHHAIPVTARLLRDIRKYGLKVPVFGTFPNCTEDTIRTAGKASENYIGAHSFTSWYDESPGMAQVREITLNFHPGTEKPYRSKNYAVGWVMATVLYEGIKRAGKDLNAETLVAALETIHHLDTKGICGPITFSATDRKGLDYCKLFKADPENGKLIPISEWRKPKKQK